MSSKDFQVSRLAPVLTVILVLAVLTVTTILSIRNTNRVEAVKHDLNMAHRIAQLWYDDNLEPKEVVTWQGLMAKGMQQSAGVILWIHRDYRTKDSLIIIAYHIDNSEAYYQIDASGTITKR